MCQTNLGFDTQMYQARLARASSFLEGQMTTIAVGYDKQGCLCMASDSRMVGEYIDPGQFCKVHRVGDKLIGVSGNASTESRFLNWVKGGERPVLKDDDFCAVVLRPSGVLHYFDGDMAPIRIGVPAAIGTGCEFAMGAMMAGADVAEAVRIAKMLDNESGGRVWVKRLK